jgi:hypothetical protein
MATKTAKPGPKAFEEALLKWLKERGALTDVTRGIAAQYASLCEVANSLQENIDANGAITDEGRRNWAVSDLVKVVKQGSDLLVRLGYNPDSIAREDTAEL